MRCGAAFALLTVVHRAAFCRLHHRTQVTASQNKRAGLRMIAVWTTILLRQHIAHSGGPHSDPIRKVIVTE
jgi:hypothetical protein